MKPELVLDDEGKRRRFKNKQITLKVKNDVEDETPSETPNDQSTTSHQHLFNVGEFEQEFNAHNPNPSNTFLQNEGVQKYESSISEDSSTSHSTFNMLDANGLQAVNQRDLSLPLHSQTEKKYDHEQCISTLRGSVISGQFSSSSTDREKIPR